MPLTEVVGSDEAPSSFPPCVKAVSDCILVRSGSKLQPHDEWLNADFGMKMSFSEKNDSQPNEIRRRVNKEPKKKREGESVRRWMTRSLPLT